MKPLDEVLLKPLLRLSPMQTGESLPSLLTRLAILNYYGSPSIMQALSHSKWANCPSWEATFQRLEVLTGIAASDLYAASDHALVTSRSVFDRDGWLPLELTKKIPFWSPPPQRGSVHFTQASCYCPHCLTEAAYHHLAWRPVPMAVCLIHNCLLVDACPQCRSRISIRDIVLVRCPHCQFDLRQATTTSILNEAWGHIAQETLWNWLTGKPAIDYSWGWPDSHPPILCNLAEGLARTILAFPECFPPHPFGPTSPLKIPRSSNVFNHLPPSIIYWAYTSALKWMVDWPEGFREFLHRCAPKRDSSLERELGYFYSWISRRWNNDKFSFVREAFLTFRLDRTQWVAEQPKQNLPLECIFAYANLEETAQILQTPEYMVRRLGQLGMIHEVRMSPAVFYLRSDLRALKRHWNELLPLEEAAEWLGVTPEIVLALTKEQALKVERKPEQVERTVFFTRNAVARLLDRVNSRTGELNSQKGLIPLVDAAGQLNCVHVNEARLLKRVLSSGLHAWRSPLQRDDWGVGKISFAQKDIDAILNEIALSRDWLCADEVSAQMGVEEDVFVGWIDQGLIKQVIVYNGEPYLKPREIEKFSAEYIFDREAQKLLDISWQRLFGYICRGKLKPVAGPDLDGCIRYLLPRKMVERLAKRLKKRACQAALVTNQLF